MTRPIDLRHPEMSLSERVHALHEIAHQIHRRRDTFEGANLLVERANEASDEARRAMDEYGLAMLNNMPSNARLALERAAKHFQTAHVLACSAESTIGREQRREPGKARI